jgi:hypothetical protein
VTKIIFKLPNHQASRSNTLLGEPFLQLSVRYSYQNLSFNNLSCFVKQIQGLQKLFSSLPHAKVA